jgi:hypothetical protein
MLNVVGGGLLHSVESARVAGVYGRHCPPKTTREGLACKYNKGMSVWFPRLVCVLDDKSPEEATGAEQVAEMYRRKGSAQNHNAKDVEEDY